MTTPKPMAPTEAWVREASGRAEGLQRAIDLRVEQGLLSTRRGDSVKTAVRTLLGHRWGPEWAAHELRGLDVTDVLEHDIPVCGRETRADFVKRFHDAAAALDAIAPGTLLVDAPKARSWQYEILREVVQRHARAEVVAQKYSLHAFTESIDSEFDEGRINFITAGAYKTGSRPLLLAALKHHPNRPYLNGLRTSTIFNQVVTDNPKRQTSYRSWCRGACRIFSYRHPGVIMFDEGVVMAQLVNSLERARLTGAIEETFGLALKDTVDDVMRRTHKTDRAVIKPEAIADMFPNTRSGQVAESRFRQAYELAAMGKIPEHGLGVNATPQTPIFDWFQ